MCLAHRERCRFCVGGASATGVGSSSVAMGGRSVQAGCPFAFAHGALRPASTCPEEPHRMVQPGYYRETAPIQRSPVSSIPLANAGVREHALGGPWRRQRESARLRQYVWRGSVGRPHLCEPLSDSASRPAVVLSPRGAGMPLYSGTRAAWATGRMRPRLESTRTTWRRRP